MKICVSGTSCTGKTTFISDFLKQWPNYTTPTETYRDVIKNRAHSSSASKEVQDDILNFLVDQATKYSKEDNVIFDRCVLDNLAYTTWLSLKGKVDEEYVNKVRHIVNITLSMYDIILYTPLTSVAVVNIEDDNFRDTDPEYRIEIDNIFKAFQQSYYKGNGAVFPKENTPALIELIGSREQRIQLVKLYLNEEGQPYDEKESLISDVIL